MSKKGNSQLANDLLEAFQEMAADLCGETIMTGYETERDVMTLEQGDSENRRDIDERLRSEVRSSCAHDGSL